MSLAMATHGYGPASQVEAPARVLSPRGAPWRRRLLALVLPLLVCLLSNAVVAVRARALGRTMRLLPSRLAQLEPLRVPFAPSVAPGDWRPRAESRELGLILRLSPLESRFERRLRIDRHRPSPLLDNSDASDAKGASARSRQRAALASAALFEAAGDCEAACYAYERALVEGVESVDLWQGLGRARLLCGDGPAAEAAYLAALELAEPADDPIAFVDLEAQLERELAKIYLLDGRFRDAAIALDSAQGLSPMAPEVAFWLARNAFPLRFDRMTPADHAPVVWPATPRRHWLVRAESRFWSALSPEQRALLRRNLQGLRSAPRHRVLILALAAAAALFFFSRLIRPRGDLVVAIEYPEELRGLFRVRLAKSKNRWPRPSRGARVEVLKGGVSSRCEHHLVNRETHFHGLLARRCWVTVEGVLIDPASDETLSDFFDKKMVRVRHRRSVRLDFDAWPESCPVDVEVHWHDRPAEEIAVVARGVEMSPLRAAGPIARLQLERGEHRLVVGCGDRVMERVVNVNCFQPTRIRFDLAGEDVIFKGCPPAVDPYLRADFETAARALERDGQATRAYLMLAEVNQERGEVRRAADYFESAGQHREAANLWAQLGDPLRAATLYLDAEEPLQAARMYEAAAEPVKAGQAYERGGDFDQAIECYQRAGAVSRWINALERRGEAFVAAQVALEHEERPRAIRLLQCIVPDDPDYAEACWLLAGAFEHEGHWDLAVQKLEQHIATYRFGTAPADKCSHLAELFDKAGRFERALEALEDLRQREPTYPNVASRIELLRKRRSAAGRIGRASADLATAQPATELVAESRYEIIEEIGRGGMGVVCRARDRRLDRIVALKRLSEDLRRHHPRALQLFMREAQAAARLNHRNIVTVYDTDQEDGTFFITMELLDGESFQTILAERGRLSVESVAEIGMQVAEGLEYAHDRGVIHRDIKTANLFFTRDRVVKIMDFGLAKMFEEVRAGTTVISGTPFYMSPEQIVGGVVDQRTDLYSLGVTLFELSTGRVPFNEGEIAYHHRHTPPPDPRAFVPDVPAAFAELLLQLLAKDPEERVASAAEVRVRLEPMSALG